MRRRQVTYSATAEDDLDSIFAVVASKASPATALGFTERIDSFCRSLDYASERGTRHDDFRAGLRSVGFERRVTVVFHVTEDAVLILRIFYAGRDWRAALDDLRR